LLAFVVAEVAGFVEVGVGLVLFVGFAEDVAFAVGVELALDFGFGVFGALGLATVEGTYGPATWTSVP
jgi:hypothetical protein